MRINKYKRIIKRQASTIGAYTILIIVGLLAFAYSFTYSIDTTINNQDIMLCNSAKISGNKEYLKKCECYYKFNNIDCIQNQ